MSIMYVHNNIT